MRHHFNASGCCNEMPTFQNVINLFLQIPNFDGTRDPLFESSHWKDESIKEKEKEKQAGMAQFFEILA